MSHALQHGTQTLIYSNHPRKAAASTCLAINFRTLAPPLSAVQALMLAVVVLKQPTIESYTLFVSHGMNGVTLSYCFSGDYPTRGHVSPG